MINYDLSRIRGIAFDVDGVLSTSLVLLMDELQPCRSANTKDGYALQLAVKKGLELAIITGGRSEAVRERYEGLGIQHVCMGASTKLDKLQAWMDGCGLKPDEVIYMGDDIPDYEAMRHIGCPCCPADAVPEIKSVSLYVSPLKGGMGCARDVVEQVMRAKGLWMTDAEAFGW